VVVDFALNTGTTKICVILRDKCCLLAVQVFIKASRADEMVEGGPGDAHDLGDGSLGDLLLQEHPDFLLLAVKLGRSQRPFGAAEQATLGSGGGKPFLAPLGDQVPLDLFEALGKNSQFAKSCHHKRL
jgi:hypothetical protein